MFQETRQPAKRWFRAERQRPVVAAGLGHCGTGMSPKGKGGRKKKRGRGVFFAGACFRCLDPWRGRLAVTHSRGSAQGWDRLVADRAGPIGRAVRRCGGCQGPRGCDWVFSVVTTFSPLAVLVDSHRGEPGLRLRCRSTAGPLGCHSSCAGCLLAGVEDWRKAEVGDSPLVRTASRHRTCALVRLSTSSTSDERQAPRFHGGCLGVGLGDRRPQTSDLIARIVMLLTTFADFSVRRAQWRARAFHG